VDIVRIARCDNLNVTATRWTVDRVCLIAMSRGCKAGGCSQSSTVWLHVCCDWLQRSYPGVRQVGNSILKLAKWRISSAGSGQFGWCVPHYLRHRIMWASPVRRFPFILCSYVRKSKRASFLFLYLI